jgi:hypothetical protein
MLPSSGNHQKAEVKEDRSIFSFSLLPVFNRWSLAEAASPRAWELPAVYGVTVYEGTR